jgi:hypothetical protein
MASQSIWGGLAGLLKNPEILQAGGRMLSSAAQASASNRGVKLDASMEQEKLRQSGEASFLNFLLEAAQQKEAAAGDAWKRMQQADCLPLSTQFALPVSPPHNFARESNCSGGRFDGTGHPPERRSNGAWIHRNDGAAECYGGRCNCDHLLDVLEFLDRLVHFVGGRSYFIKCVLKIIQSERYRESIELSRGVQDIELQILEPSALRRRQIRMNTKPIVADLDREIVERLRQNEGLV